MYTVMEGVAVGGIVLAVGAVIFVAACLVVMIAAGIRAAAVGTHRLLGTMQRRTLRIWAGDRAPRITAGAIQCGFHGHVAPQNPAHEIAGD